VQRDGLKAVPHDYDDTTMTTSGVTRVEDGLEAVLDDHLLYQAPGRKQTLERVRRTA
jgi:hypothetical protein